MSIRNRPIDTSVSQDAEDRKQRRSPRAKIIGLEPLLVTVREAGALLGFGKTKIFQLLECGALERRKVNGATRITLRSVRELAGV
jgi:hypothetical protein